MEEEGAFVWAGFMLGCLLMGIIVIPAICVSNNNTIKFVARDGSEFESYNCIDTTTIKETNQRGCIFVNENNKTYVARILVTEYEGDSE